MKSVYLLRHAKSSWDDASLADYDRPLAPRGRDAAPRIGAYMKAEGLVPDAVLVSGARRALETWESVRPYFGDPHERVESNLYMATPDLIFGWLRLLRDDVGSVLLIGHNPGFEEMAARLAGDGKRKAVRRMRKKYPTGALAVLRFDVEAWADIEWGQAFLERFVRPRDLG
jgi:phosphohistidine phosphatase